jgi:hypothetical protein
VGLRVAIVEPSLGRLMQPVYGRLGSALSELGVRSWIGSHPADAPAGWPLIAQDHVDIHPSASQCVLGLRTLNRYERMNVLSRAGLTSVPWGSPKTHEGLRKLLDQWVVSEFIVKSDNSENGSAVHLRHRPRLPVRFVPSQDVIMRVADAGPLTLKLYAFQDQPIVAGMLGTPSIRSKSFTYRTCRFHKVRWTPRLRRIAVEAGRAIRPFGVGLFSLDLMVHRHQWSIIEANTSGASRLLAFPDPSDRAVLYFARAIRYWLTAARAGPTWREVCARRSAFRATRCDCE